MTDSKTLDKFGSTMHVRRIAGLQKGILLCILANIIILLLHFLGWPVHFFGLPVFATTCVFVFMLARILYGTIFGILLAILTVIPFLGIIGLLIVNGKATDILRQNNINVGLLGAKLSDIKQPVS